MLERNVLFEKYVKIWTKIKGNCDNECIKRKLNEYLKSKKHNVIIKIKGVYLNQIYFIYLLCWRLYFQDKSITSKFDDLFSFMPFLSCSVNA